MADVSIKGRYTVKAAGEPWTGTMKLGEWEQMATMVYVPTIYFYGPPTYFWAGSTTSKLVEVLRDSLAQTLFHFYPFAGRVHPGPNGSTELRCENQGAEVIEAESECQLADFGDLSCCFPEFQSLIPLVDPMQKPLHELPLVSVQLTRFRCGALSTGLVTNHGIADGMASYHFITEWTRIDRGEPLQTPPVHDRTLLRAGEPPRGPGFTDVDPLVLDLMMDGMPRKKKTSTAMLPLSKSQIDNLKFLANSSAEEKSTKDTSTPGSRPFSRYEVLTVHIWRCVCKVKGHDGEEAKAVAITLDARNAVMMVAAVNKAGELVNKPLGFTCMRIRETIAKVMDEYVQTDMNT